jgi:hypothetical protein
MTARPSRLLFCLTAVLLLPACDSSTDEGAAAKPLNATVSGGRSETMSGSVFAVESQDPNGTSWGVSMNDLDSGFKILIAWDSATPSTGTYPVSDASTESALRALVILDSLLDQYISTTGRLR